MTSTTLTTTFNHRWDGLETIMRGNMLHEFHVLSSLHPGLGNESKNPVANLIKGLSPKRGRPLGVAGWDTDIFLSVGTFPFWSWIICLGSIKIVSKCNVALAYGCDVSSCWACCPYLHPVVSKHLILSRKRTLPAMSSLTCHYLYITHPLQIYCHHQLT